LKIKILVASHKKYQMPEDEIYLPVHAGKSNTQINLGYQGDDTGENISVKNPNYCELTALYWAWKNLTADYIGLVHYRRHFSFHRKLKKWNSLLTNSQAQNLCKNYDIIVPKKRYYIIETNYTKYIHAHPKEPLDTAIEIINQEYPDYIKACKIVMNRTWAYMFNMFIMKKELLDNYCQWLFDILKKIEVKIDISNYSATQARVFGYLAERLFNVWLEKSKLKFYECYVIFMEKQNWLKKGLSFIKRKFFSEYE
jgi:hypothetical protein